MTINTINNYLDKLDKFITWAEKKVPKRTYFNALSFIVGLVTSLATVLLKTIVQTAATFVNSISNVDATNILYFAMPIVGIALTVLYVHFYVKDSLSHGVSKILFAISRNDSKIAPHNKHSSIIASTLTIAFGGSVGLEAPSALTGAAIGSNLAERFKVDYRERTLLLGCGTAAAIACIFKAPIAGVIFALEVLMLDLTMASIVPLLLSAVTGSIVSMLLLGKTVVFNFAIFESFYIESIFHYILLGICCGFVGLYFTRVLEFIELTFAKKIKSKVKKVLIGGGVLGVLIFLFPPLYGEGYETLKYIFSENPEDVLQHSLFISLADNIWFVVLFLVFVVIFKAFAVAFTTGGGGVGGVFAPSLFLGGITGFVFASVARTFHIEDLSQHNFALVGMSGVMAAVMQSPLTAIFLIAEITGGYELFIPIILTATFAYLTIHRFEKHSFYTKRLAANGDLLTHDKDQAVLTLLKLSNLIETDFCTININACFSDLMVEVADSKRNIFPVIDDENNLKGIILLDDIRKVMFDSELYETSIIRFIKQPKAVIEQNSIDKNSMNMKEVMEIFENTCEWNLPVVSFGKYVGYLSKSKILTSYRDLLIKVSYDM